MADGRWVALMRGINVGGKNRLPMADLRALFEARGCTDVRTYIQSGNVVLTTSDEVAGTLADDIAADIRRGFAITSPVVLRSAEALRAAAAANPFLADEVDERALHVAFLADEPSEAAVKALDPHRSPGDAFEVRGREVYLHCPNGVARTKLTNDWFDRRLGTVSTMRNWRTVSKLIEMT